MKEKERGDRERDAQKKVSPRLGYARAALVEKLEDWGGNAPSIPPRL
jgi:hypothetical protein